MAVKAKGGGLRALADMSAKNVIFLDGSLGSTLELKIHKISGYFPSILS